MSAWRGPSTTSQQRPYQPYPWRWRMFAKVWATVFGAADHDETRPFCTACRMGACLGPKAANGPHTLQNGETP